MIRFKGDAGMCTSAKDIFNMASAALFTFVVLGFIGLVLFVVVIILAVVIIIDKYDKQQWVQAG